MINRAPYRSQWSDPSWVEAIAVGNADPCADPTWVKHGFPSEHDYRYWTKRVCGLACLESILDHWGISRPNRFVLLQEAIRNEVYVPKDDGSVLGLVYRPFATWTGDYFGLAVEPIVRASLPDFLASIPSGGFGMASVSQEIRNPMRPRISSSNGGHLVLVLGQEDGSVVFHNPSGVPPYQAFATLAIDRFSDFFAGQGMAIEKGGG